MMPACDDDDDDNEDDDDDVLLLKIVSQADAGQKGREETRNHYSKSDVKVDIGDDDARQLDAKRIQRCASRNDCQRYRCSQTFCSQFHDGAQMQRSRLKVIQQGHVAAR